MTRPSRPLIGLLVATVAFFALWIVALKPSSSNPSSSGAGVGQYQAAINAAKAAVTTQNQTNAAAAGTTAPAAAPTPAATTPAPATATPAAATTAAATKPATTTHHAAARAHHGAARPHAAAATQAATKTERVNVVNRALAHHKVLALLFYNRAGADDQAVKHELSVIPTRRGRVVKLAVPLSELASYPVVTNQVLIQASPTLVIIDRSAHAFTLVGFDDGLEIAQRIDQALSMP